MKRLNKTILESRLAELGLSQSALAERLGFSRESISQWMLGKTFPRPKALLDLARLVKLPFDQLVLVVDEARPTFAFRTNRKTKPTELQNAQAKAMADGLELLRQYCTFEMNFSLPSLAEPRLDYHYVQSVVAELRAAIGCALTSPIDERSLIAYFDKLRTIFVPVLWGEKGPNALHVGLGKNAVHFVYINLQKRISDVKFWIAHELAHILTPGIKENEAEAFADAFAGVFLFPGGAAAILHDKIMRLPGEGAIVNTVIETASTQGISPITVWKETERWAEQNKKQLIKLDIYGAAANYDKSVKTVAEVLFEEDLPSTEKYLAGVQAWYGTRFFDALRRFLREEKKGPGAVQAIMNVPISDAKSIWGCLVDDN